MPTSTFAKKVDKFSTSLRFQNRAECGKGTELQGRTLHILYRWGEQLGWGKTYTGMGDTTNTLLMRETIGVGTPHNIERQEGDTAYKQFEVTADIKILSHVHTEAQN